MSSHDFNAEERINKLEQRVEFLESELGASLEGAQAERSLRSLFPHDTDIEFKEDSFDGYFIRGTGLTTDEANAVTDKIDAGRSSMDVDWALIESADGLGIEVWTV